MLAVRMEDNIVGEGQPEGHIVLQHLGEPGCLSERAQH